MRPNRPRPHGFTLVELLVVIGILSVLTGLTLAGIQRVRAAAARAECSNNLRQIAIAVGHFRSVHSDLFPVGIMIHEMPGLSWHAQLLPFVEQDPLGLRTRAAYQTTIVLTHPVHEHMGTQVKMFVCPSDVPGHDPNLLVGPLGRKVGLTSYLGVSGTSLFHRDGCLYENSRVRGGDVRDGLSNTILVGVRPAATGPVCYSSWYTGVWAQGTDGSCATTLGMREPRIMLFPGCPREPGRFGPGREGNPCDYTHFWSLHGPGANFAFADGSVRFLSYSADSVMPALATRAGGEAAAIPD